MSDLTGSTIADTYKDVIHVGNNNDGVPTGNLVALSDGGGNLIPITLKNDAGTGDGEIKLGNSTTGTVALSATNIELDAHGTGGFVGMSAPSEISISSENALEISGVIELSGAKVGSNYETIDNTAGVATVKYYGNLQPTDDGTHSLGTFDKKTAHVYTGDIKFGDAGAAADVNCATLSTSASNSLLTFAASGGTAEKVLTQSYESLNNSGMESTLESTDAMVTEIVLTGSGGNVDITLPTGIAGQTKTVILTTNTTPVNVTINTNLLTWTAKTKASCQLVKGTSNWIVLTDSTT